MKLRALLTSTLSLLLLAPNFPAQADTQPIKVMSRNLYLGADVGVWLLQLIPNMPRCCSIYVGSGPEGRGFFKAQRSFLLKRFNRRKLLM